MIRLISNRFHETSARITIKDVYGRDGDPLAMLDYEAYTHCKDAPYARRKLTEIKAKLCPAGRDCRCVHTYEGTLEPTSSILRARKTILPPRGQA